MGAKRPDVPAAIKRELRQRCRYGCAICGSPVFDYEHIEGYEVTGHDVEQMTLLCTKHHREKTAGRMGVARVWRAAKDPYNRRQKLAGEHELYFEGSEFTLDFGSISFLCSTDLPVSAPVQVDSEPIIAVRFEDGAVLLDILIRDADNNPVLVVRRGELRYALHHWDVTFEGTQLTIWRGPRDIVLEIQLAPPGKLIVHRAELWARGVLLRIGKSCVGGSGIEVANSGLVMEDLVFQNYYTVLAVGDYLGMEGHAITLPLSERWWGGVPVRAGTFSRKGGGSRVPFSPLPDALTTCAYRPFQSVVPMFAQWSEVERNSSRG